MNERPSITEATRRVDIADHADQVRNHLGAVAANAVLEAMFTLHGRARFSGSDWLRADLVRRALLDLPGASAEEQAAADVGNMDPIADTPLLREMQRAIDNASQLPVGAGT